MGETGHRFKLNPSGGGEVGGGSLLLSLRRATGTPSGSLFSALDHLFSPK